MAEPVTPELIQRMLQPVLDEQRLTRARIEDLTQRVSGMEIRIGALVQADARMQASIDRLTDRVERIERRLGILDPAHS
jgi:hypothetical protein